MFSQCFRQASTGKKLAGKKAWTLSQTWKFDGTHSAIKVKNIPSDSKIRDGSLGILGSASPEKASWKGVRHKKASF